MRAMFTMMNNARLNVGLQGVGIAERATQRAVDYALERVQGQRDRQPAVDRRASRRAADAAADARADDGRAGADLLCVRARSTGRGRATSDAGARAEVLTPLAKAWGTDVGCEVASLGIQVHGGMGFVEETGAAQHLRDARIAPIYEGTNGIQAADLVGRKLGLEGGAAFDALIADIRGEAEDARLLALADAVERIARLLRRRRPTTGWPASYPFLTMCAVLVAGWLLERIAREARRRRRVHRRHGARRRIISSGAIVPEAIGLEAAAGAGAELLYAVPAEALA